MPSAFDPAEVGGDVVVFGFLNVYESLGEGPLHIRADEE
jgi:hypothetical protein